MLVIARSYPVLEAVAVEISLVSRAGDDGKLFSRMLVSQVKKGSDNAPTTLALLEELANALQEYVWSERGV